MSHNPDTSTYVTNQISAIMKRTCAAAAIIIPLVSAKCGVCSNGVSMLDPYEGHLPSFGLEPAMTCEEYDTFLSGMSAEECSNAKDMWKLDIPSLCGCEGAKLRTSVDGGCSICEAGTEIENPSSVLVTTGFPLSSSTTATTTRGSNGGNFVAFTCQDVLDLGPYLKYSSTCNDFQSWYSKGMCCNALNSSAGSIHTFTRIALVLVVGSYVVLW